jgi:hypothetical protein
MLRLAFLLQSLLPGRRHGRSRPKRNLADDASDPS